MRRKLLNLAAIAALCLWLVPTPVGAAPRQPAAQPAVAADTEGACITSGYYSTFGYHSNSSPTATRSGISANIDTNAGGFDPCNSGVHAVSDGAVAWIEIKPRDWTAGDGSGHSTIRLGIVECDSGTDPVAAVCHGDEHPHFFYSKAGCNGYETYPDDYIDLGAADNAPHDYAIYDTGFGYWNLFIDGSYGVAINDTDTRVSCWLDENLAVYWGSYRMDLGDSTGSAGGAELFFHDARYGRPGLGWFSPNWTSGDWQHDQAVDEVGTLSNGDDLKVYQSS